MFKVTISIINSIHPNSSVMPLFVTYSMYIYVYIPIRTSITVIIYYILQIIKNMQEQLTKEYDCVVTQRNTRNVKQYCI